MSEKKQDLVMYCMCRIRIGSKGGAQVSSLGNWVGRGVTGYREGKI